MIKKCLGLLLLLLPGLILPAKAQDTGSIRLELETGELPVINGAFTLYRVGDPISDGYRIREEFGGGFVRDEDAQSPHLAQWLSDMEEKQGLELLLDVDGNVVFSGLEDGLYLLEQTERTDGFYPIQPFLLTVPGAERCNIRVYLEPLPIVSESPATGQDPAVYVGLAGLVLSALGLVICRKSKKLW